MLFFQVLLTQNNWLKLSERPITVSDVFANVFEQILIDEIDKNKEVTHANQFGFKDKASKQHAINLLRENLRWIRKRPTKNYAYAVYLDFSKAFDKVTRFKLFVKLHKYLKPPFWRALVLYYLVSKAHTYSKSGYSECFQTTVEVKQGGKLSPKLFIIYINKLITILLEMGLLFRLKNVETGCLVFADNTSIIAETIEETQIALKLIEKYCKLEDIIINEGKTQWMKLGEPLRYTKDANGLKVLETPMAREDEIFVINNTVLEKVSKFKFLGMWITSNYSNKEHIKSRKKSAMAALADVKLLGFNKPFLNIGLKKLLFNTYVSSRIMYALENCHLKDTDINEIETIEANLLKRSLGLSTTSYTTELFAAMSIKTFRQAYEIRQASFLSQLTQNEITSKVVLQNNEGNPLKDIIDKIGQSRIMVNEAYTIENRKYSLIRASRDHIKKQLKLIDELKKNELTKTASFLLENYNEENKDLLQIILSPQRELRIFWEVLTRVLCWCHGTVHIGSRCRYWFQYKMLISAH